MKTNRERAMKKYMVQYRPTHEGSLLFLDFFTARSELGAIKQGVKCLCANDSCVEIMATEMAPEEVPE